MNLPELLAPAGSRESLVAAIRAGADAVYLGGREFSARRYAKNFDNTELEEAISYAHLRNVRVYVTVNTLILDREIDSIAEYLLFLYKSGADAVLIQDTGVASVAREIVPGLPLHASTQMTIYNREGVAFAKKQGFSRVVLARELSMSDIAEIGRSPDCQGIGLEMFIHGALCYSYSGQCLLSSFIGGRSGNRGMCAQPCRKPYTMVRGYADVYGRPVSISPVRSEGRYLLSTRDLSLYPVLDKVVHDLPVASLKIEGRMRSPRYVSTVVSIYRNALDAIRDGKWTPSAQDETDLALAFNRGFTTGYAGGSRHRGLMGRDRPDHRGLLVGTVSAYDPMSRRATVTMQSDIVPKPGDGVVFHEPGSGREYGMIVRDPVVGKATGLSLQVNETLSKGTLLYLTRKSGMEGEEEEGHAGTGRESPWIPVDISVTWDSQDRPIISGRCAGKEGTMVSFGCTGTPMTKARTQPLTEDAIRMQISKTGGTPFIIRELMIAYPGGLFSPVGDLNRIRRELFLGLSQAVLTSWQPTSGERNDAKDQLSLFHSQNRISRTSGENTDIPPMQLSVYTSGYDEAGAALEAGCDLVYFEPDSPGTAASGWCQTEGVRDSRQIRDPGGIVSEVTRLCLRFPGKIVWKWPVITDRDFIDHSLCILEGLRDQGLAGIMIDSPGIADRARITLPGLPVYGGQGLNIANHRSAHSLAPLFRRVTLSPELSGGDIRSLVSRLPAGASLPEFEVIVQGNADVLISRDCLGAGIYAGRSGCTARGITDFQGIQDSTGRIFPVWTGWDCRTHIGNSSETCLADELPSLLESGIASIAIDARHRTPAYAEEMVRLYREAMKMSQNATKKHDFSAILSRIRKISLGGITAARFRGSLCLPESEE